MMKKIFQNIGLILLGVFLFFFLLEAGLRIAGGVRAYAKEAKTQAMLKKKGVFTILCLGESTTDGEWPPYLNDILNTQIKDMECIVIDKGQVATRTEIILDSLEEYLDVYTPDMVITMMGVNDPLGVYSYFSPVTHKRYLNFIYSLKSVRLIRLIVLHIKAHVFGGRTVYAKEELFIPDQEKVEALQAHIREDSFYTQAYYDLSDIYVKQGDFVQAERVLLEAMNANPREADSYVRLGIFYALQQKENFAVKYFEQAVAIKPCAEYYFEYGLSYMRSGQFDKAYDVFVSVPQEMQKHEQIYFGFCDVLVSQGELERAQEYLRQGAELFDQKILSDENIKQIYMNLAALYAVNGFSDELAGWAMLCISLFPEDSRGYIFMGKALQQQERVDEALPFMRQALGLDPSARNYCETARCYIQLKRYLAAFELLEGLPDELKNDVWIRAAYSEVYYYLGKYKLLEETLIVNSRLFSSEDLSRAGGTMMYVKCAAQLLGEKQDDRARYIIDLAQEISPNHEEVRFLLSEQYKKAGNFEKALAVLQDVQSKRTSVKIVKQIATLYTLQKEFVKAEATLMEGLSRFSESALLYAQLGEVYLQWGKDDDAKRMFQKALGLHEDNHAVMRKLLLYFENDAPTQKAFDFYASRYNPSSDERDATNVHALVFGDVYLHENKFELAESSFRSSYADAFDIDSSLAGLAMSSLRQEKYDEAHSYFTLLNEYRKTYYPESVKNNYRRLAEILEERNIALVSVQYPMRTVEQLKNMLHGFTDVIFVDNEMSFKEKVYEEGYDAYFKDAFALDFGHCTAKGNVLLAENIAHAILEQYFKK